MWEVVSGENSGARDGRESFDKADLVNVEATMGPSVAHSAVSYWVERADLSRSPSVPGSTPAPFAVVTAYRINPDGVNDFIEGVKKVNDAIMKTNYAVSGPSRWYQLVNGGDVPTYVLVGDRANWAAFQPNDKTLDAMMAEAYGKEQGAAIMASLRKTFHSLHVSTYQYHPELSYIAPAPK
ncbi:MAG: hypothetical protein ACLQIH_16405 [Myxococcaceae bacterium]